MVVAMEPWAAVEAFQDVDMLAGEVYRKRRRAHYHRGLRHVSP